MKRAEQLQALSREHHQSLVMAKKIGDIAKRGNKKEMSGAIDLVNEYYDSELEEHFQHEEHTIFSVIFKSYKQHIPLATPLLKQHGFLRMLVPSITIDTAKNDLAEFAEILKEHTHIEERELFPVIESTFTEEELDKVLNFVPVGQK